MNIKKRKVAGGKATEAGMSFQARVGSWFAAHILAGTPVGSRFGVEVTAHATAVRFESADGMDDVVVNLSTGGRLYLQCKTTTKMPMPKRGD